MPDDRKHAALINIKFLLCMHHDRRKKIGKKKEDAGANRKYVSVRTVRAACDLNDKGLWHSTLAWKAACLDEAGEVGVRLLFRIEQNLHLDLSFCCRAHALRSPRPASPVPLRPPRAK